MTTIAIMVPVNSEPKIVKVTNSIFVLDIGNDVFHVLPRGICFIKEIVDETDLEVFNYINDYESVINKALNIQAEYLNGTKTLVQEDGIRDFEALVDDLMLEFSKKKYNYVIIEYAAIYN